MIHMNWGGFVGAVETAFRKHTPSILTGLGIAGMLGTTVLAVRATPEALRRIEEKKEEEGVRELGVVDTIKVAGPCYISPVITGAVSVACLIGANNVSNRRNAALSAAYSFSESALRTYREQVAETVGKRKEKEIRDKVNQSYLEKTDVSPKTIIISGNENGRVLWYDPIVREAFYATVEEVKNAENRLNFKLRSHMFMSLNAFYEILYETLGLPYDGFPFGGEIGWNVNRAEMSLDWTVGTHKNSPCFVLDYGFSPPETDYRDF